MNYILGLFLHALCVSIMGRAPVTPPTVIHIEGQDYWSDVAHSDLSKALRRKINDNIAKNVIVFVGDGMGPSTVTAARIYQGQVKDGWGESNSLSFEKFPVTGLSKTYSINKQTADSAATGTAMFTGIKTNQKMIGLDMFGIYRGCDPLVNNKSQLDSFMAWGQAQGKHTGIVTTTRVTHATPASTYAHINDRDWECDSVIPANQRQCVKDIARQLVEDAPGKNFKVILGGGRRAFGSESEDTSDTDSCFRSDGRDLVADWRKNKANADYVTTKMQLADVDTKATDHLLGLFADGHLNYAGENEPTRPSLKVMTQKAIEVLRKGPKGFFLMVEGGKIDLAHHENYARLALMEAVELSEAVAEAVALTSKEDTLIVVTADHSHPFTMAGYSDRGADIMGYADTSNDSFYEILTYANGPGFANHHIPLDSANCSSSNCTHLEKGSATYFKDMRKDPSRDQDVHYRASSARMLSLDTHGGEDVAIYAQGPMAHLLSGVHEQNVIAHVLSCAACLGPQKELCCSNSSGRRQIRSTAHSASYNTWLLILPTLLAWILPRKP